MAIKITCDSCSTTVGSGENVTCTTCAKTACTECEATSKRLLCPECAEDEFGDDEESREPNDDDVAAFIEYAVITDDVGDLAAAIRRGDMSEAEHLLDKIAREVPGWSDRISITRYSPRAKAA